MNASEIPRSYEELEKNPELLNQLENQGLADRHQRIAILLDASQVPVILQPSKEPFTLPDFEDDPSLLLGEDEATTQERLSAFIQEPYIF